MTVAENLATEQEADMDASLPEILGPDSAPCHPWRGPDPG